jgi:hypothetical protein
VIRIRAGRPGFVSRRDRDCYFCHRVKVGCGTHRPPIRWVPRLFPRRKSGRGVRLTTHLQVVPRLSCRHTSSPLMVWCSVLPYWWAVV